MSSNHTIGRISGILLLFVFISGILIFQILQGPSLFSENFLSTTSQNANKIIGSVVLGIFSGIASIIVAILLLPIFKRTHYTLAYLYVAFTILNFISIMIDNVSVLTLLELSKEFSKQGSDSAINLLGTIAYEKHSWTHYLYLLISCFPVFILYYTLYVSNLVPRILSIFGLFAVALMFIEEVLLIFGHGISMNMLLPMALIQLTLPLWLIFKGLKSPILKKKNE